jgi:hypothetical protein
VRPVVLGKLKKLIHLIGSRTRDLPACSIWININEINIKGLGLELNIV